MNIFNIFKKSSEESPRKSQWDDFWYKAISSCMVAGVNVTPENALRVSAVWACNKVISETIACLPFLVYNSKDGQKRDTRNIRCINSCISNRIEYRRVTNGYLTYRLIRIYTVTLICP